MNQHVPAPKPAAVARVVHYGGRGRVVRPSKAAGQRDFNHGEAVRALVEVKNDGIDPRRDIGETLVQRGDAGAVLDRWSFLGEIYYTVQFAPRATVVIMRGREMAGTARA